MTHQEIIQNKIFHSTTAFEKRLNYYRFKNYKITFTNGCFDILHLGHIDYLSKAADLGDILIVGLNSDASVQKLKGPERPINNLEMRSMMLASLSFVDAVVVFEEETPENLIKFITPHTLVKGNDYTIEIIAGAEYVMAQGGKVITLDLLPGYSTSLLIKKILNYFSK